MVGMVWNGVRELFVVDWYEELVPYTRVSLVIIAFKVTSRLVA